MERAGYRFHPTDYELIYYYLLNQLLGNTKPVEETMSEIDFYAYDPVSLPSLSRNQSANGIYYFLTLKQYTNLSRIYRKRSSEHGNWNLSGGVREIKDKSGETIGCRHGYRYKHKHGDSIDEGEKNRWTMHEYEITHSQYQNLDLDSYVICKLFDKREEDGQISSFAYNSTELIHHPQVSDPSTSRAINTLSEAGQEIDDLFPNDMVIQTNTAEQEDLALWDCFDPNHNIPNLQIQTPYLSQDDDEFLGELKHVDRGQVEHLFSEQYLTVQTNHENSYGMYVDDDTMPTNAQEYYSLCYSFDPKYMQLQTPYLTQGGAKSISAMSYQRP